MVVLGEFVGAGGDPPPVLEAAKGALNDIALPIGDGVKGMVVLAGWVVGDDRLAAAAPQPRPQGITVVSRIRQTPLGEQGGHQGCRNRGVPAMAGADDEPAGAAGLIDGGMDFGRAAPP